MLDFIRFFIRQTGKDTHISLWKAGRKSLIIKGFSGGLTIRAIAIIIIVRNRDSPTGTIMVRSLGH